MRKNTLYWTPDDDGQDGLRSKIDKSRIRIRLTAPHSEDRHKAASELAQQKGIHNGYT